MAKTVDPSIIWKDRIHHMWFPLSFTTYMIKNERLYIEEGFLNSVSNETLLYRVVDLQMRRNLAQKIFGTGDVILFTRADTDRQILLHNIKKPRETKDMLSDMVENIRHQRNMVGKEFFPGGPRGPMGDPDHDLDDMHDDHDPDND